MIIKHDLFKDVCFEVSLQEEGRYFGRWINMGFVNSFYIPAPKEWIEVTKKEDWKRLDQTWLVSNCFRYGKWVSL